MLFASSVFDPFFTFFATVLAFFYDLTGNYAVAIILLTLCVMIIVTPLTLKGTRSMMMMQQLQPDMKKIQARYKDDRQKLNEELLKFYKENNINPVGGCLPLLVQAPVFLVLYQVLRGLTRRVSDLGANAGWEAGQQLVQGSNFVPSKPPSIERVFDPAFLDQSSQMYQDLSQSTQMRAFGLDLSESASQAFSTGFVHALPFLVLIAIVAVTGVLQQRQIQGRNPNSQVNPQQQMIMKIMPIFLPVISFGLPAGLVLYFAVSNMYRIGQQAFISHSIYGGRENGMTWKDMFGLGSTKSGGPKPKPKSSSAKGKGKPIAASSRPSAKAAAKSGSRSKTPARSTNKGSSARATNADPDKPATTTSKKAPRSKGTAPSEPPSSTTADPGDAAKTAPDTSSSGKGPRPASPPSGGGSNLQPRARRKKR
jgi:YidC/Oxa1 family membrane protein insertase